MEVAGRSASVPALCDAVSRVVTHRVHVQGLVSPRPTAVFGPALTIDFRPARDDAPVPAASSFATVFAEAVSARAAGSVLVVSSGGYPEASHGGSVKLSRAQNSGLAGVVVDGCLRDFPELAAYDFVTWCRGETPKWGGDVVNAMIANAPIEFGGITVFPGDQVFVDSAGMVVVPASKIDEVLAGAEQIDRQDQVALEALHRAGQRRRRTSD